MYIIYTANNIPYMDAWDEAEAERIAYAIGGYYLERMEH